MIKEYKRDPIKVEEFEARRRKRERFKEKKHIRRALYIIGILALVLPALYLYYNRDILNIRNWESFFDSIFVNELMMVLVVWTPILIYCKLSYGLGGFPPYYRKRETLVLYEDGLQNGFSFVDNSGKEWYKVYEIKYTDIRRIRHDVVFKNLNVNCKVSEFIYDGEGTALHSQKTLEKECVDFYLYYYDNEDFIETLEKCSGILAVRYNRNTSKNIR
jgi:hypothetical protein